MKKQSTMKKSDKILILILVSVSAFILLGSIAIMAFFFGSIKASDSYATAINHIESNTKLISEVGEIKGYGFLPAFSISYSGGAGEATYTIRVKGEKKNVTAYFEMEKKPHDDWKIVYFSYG